MVEMRIGMSLFWVVVTEENGSLVARWTQNYKRREVRSTDRIARALESHLL